MSDSKTILITGATSGIGMATARCLHKKGYQLLLSGRSEEKLKNITSQLDGARCFVCNLEQVRQIKGIFNYCQQLSIKLDGMVHAAGYAINMPIRMMDIEHCERQMRIHYCAFLELCKCFYSRKTSNDGASIVVMSSMASVTKQKGSVMYSASKSAVNTSVLVASKEFAKRKIRVNALLPAYVDTRMNDWLKENIDISEKQPFGMIPPQNIADVVAFLLSDEARFITGALIPISAGMEA